MRFRLLLLLPFVIFLANLSNAQVQGKSGGAHTHIRLVADVSSIRPGKPFTAGLVLTMEPGWHTYWENGGETGLPTELKWTLPPGSAAGEIQWPLPEKHIDPGDILSYGYSGETMLLVEITPPASLASSKRETLKVEANWLECKEICIPGSATAELTVPMSAESTPANAGLFQKYRDQLPSPWSTSSGFALTTTTERRTVRLRLTAAPGETFVVKRLEVPDFYPEILPDVAVSRAEVTATPEDVTLTMNFKEDVPIKRQLVFRGVIVYQLQGEERKGVSVEIPLTPEFFSGGPSMGSSTSPSSGATRTGNDSAAGNAQVSLLDRSFAPTEPLGGEQSLVMYLLFAIAGGLLLNVMPCVLPVIALKVFGLVRMAGDNPRKVRTLGWFFALGILASFLALALLVIVLQFAGQQVGWGFQFQEPYFVLAMCLVVFAFGLSLFGVYEIRPPRVAVEGISGVVSKQGSTGSGHLSSFAEGVFATILATPCTAPFLGTALGFAFTQPAVVILLIFVCVAFGMALPYLLLTTHPTWLKFLPKPGAWMESLKQFMGFLMMATALWLLYILGKQLGMEAVIWTCAFLLSVGVALWMIGRYATLTSARRKVVLLWLAGIAIAAGGYWLFLERTLDIRSVIAGIRPGAESAQVESGGIPWQPFSIQLIDSELRDNKAVFVDFTAEWCLTCKVNERTVISDQRITEKIRSSGIVPVRADWTNRNPDITRLLSKFGRSGVPLYVIFPAGKPNEPIVLPEVITTGMVLEALDRATGAISSMD